jgi:hypothetical protein
VKPPAHLSPRNAKPLPIAFMSRWSGVMIFGLLPLNVALLFFQRPSAFGMLVASIVMLVHIYGGRRCCMSLRDPYDLYLAELFLDRHRFIRHGNTWTPAGTNWMHGSNDIVELGESNVSGPYRVIKRIQQHIRART